MSAQQRLTGPHEVRSGRGAVRSMVRRHPVVLFSCLAYLLAWSWWVPLVLRGEVVRPGVGWPTHLPGLLAPALAAVLVTALLDGRAGLRELARRLVRWRVGWGWWLVVAATSGLAALGAVTAVLAGDPVPSVADFTRYNGVGSLTPVLVVVVVLVVNGFGEETGWRGFAVERLLDDHDLRWTAAVVGVVWAGWHLPLFWLADSFRSFGPLLLGWFVGLMAASVVLAHLYRAGRHSILLVASWHTAFNFTAATEATGAVVATVMSVAVICWAVWLLRRSDHGGPAAGDAVASLPGRSRR